MTKQKNWTWKQGQQVIIMLYFYHVILSILFYVMIIHDGGHYGMNMLWMRRLYLFMEHESYLDPLVNPMKEPYSLDRFHSLTDSSCYIYWNYNFYSRSEIIKPKKYIALNHWEFLLATCSTLGIFPNPPDIHLKIAWKIKYPKTIIFSSTYYPISSSNLDIIHSHICVHLHYYPSKLYY